MQVIILDFSRIFSRPNLNVKTCCYSLMSLPLWQGLAGDQILPKVLQQVWPLSRKMMMAFYDDVMQLKSAAFVTAEIKSCDMTSLMHTHIMMLGNLKQ